MSMNSLGKTLVLIHFALSIVFLAWAAALLLSQVDVGQKEARKFWSDPTEGQKGVNERVAARIDERVALFKKYEEAREKALARAAEVLERVRAAEGAFGENHLFYVAELARIESGPGKQQFQGVQFTKEDLIPLVGNRPWARPEMKKPIAAEKSQVAYLADLDALVKQTRELAERTEAVTKEKEKLTVQLNGVRDKDGKVLRKGIYHLLDVETEYQNKLKEELDYLRPLWVRELYNADLLRQRRDGLVRRLKELGEQPSEILPQ